MKIPGTNAGSGSISRLRLQFADRRPKIPGPGLSDFKLRTSYIQNSNREGIRLETGVSGRKERIGVSSNREKGACSSNRVRADDSARRNIDQLGRRTKVKNSNRESLRLEIDVTQTKQTPEPNSNREIEALFSAANARPRWGSRAGGRHRRPFDSSGQGVAGASIASQPHSD
jgi:hypothetical protein